MYSKVSPESTLNVPTQHDLAALFFLYPDKRRNASTGTRELPLAAFSSAKLRGIAEDFQGGKCASLNERRALLECLRGRAAEASLENAEAMAAARTWPPVAWRVCRYMGRCTRIPLVLPG